MGCERARRVGGCGTRKVAVLSMEIVVWYAAVVHNVVFIVVQ